MTQEQLQQRAEALYPIELGTSSLHVPHDIYECERNAYIQGYQDGQEGSAKWFLIKDRFLPPKFKNILCLSSKGQIKITCVDASGKIDDFELESDPEDHWTHWTYLPNSKDYEKLK